MNTTTEPFKRRGTGKIKSTTSRKLFAELIGSDLAAQFGKDARPADVDAATYAAWCGFRAGLDLAQAGATAGEIVQALRENLASIHAEASPDQCGFAVLVRTAPSAPPFLIPSGRGTVLPFVSTDQAEAEGLRDALREKGHYCRLVNVTYRQPEIDRRTKAAGDPWPEIESEAEFSGQYAQPPAPAREGFSRAIAPTREEAGSFAADTAGTGAPAREKESPGNSVRTTRAREDGIQAPID